MAAGRVWDNELDTNALFQQHTVDEIRQIERKTRMDIEKKKEDLRQMVGERYHELIDAADTITSMKNFSGNVVASIDQMHGHCQQLKETHQCRGLTGRLDPVDLGSDKGSGILNLANQLKTLFDTPEKVWHALESGQHLEAARLYLQAQDIMTGLQTESKHSHGSPKYFLASFPILQRQWSTVSHFKSTILQESKILLGDHKASPETAAHSLCAILLLENSTPRQAFTDFLVARKAALQALFRSSRQTSIKSQVCDVVSLVMATVRHTEAVFSHRESDCLLLDVMKASSKARQSSSISLPLVPSDVMHANCAEWIATCIQDVGAGLKKLLKFVSSVKGLASIRDAVYSLVQQDNQAVTPWSATCQAVLGRPLSVWDEFMRTLVLEQLQAILHAQFVSVATKGEELLTSALKQLAANRCSAVSEEDLFDRDVALFVWSEGSGNCVNGNPLGLKGRACTPAISRICSGLDGQFGDILKDTQHFLCKEKGDGSVSLLDKVLPFDQYADTGTVQKALQSCGSMSVARICDWVQCELQRLEKILTRTEVSHPDKAVEMESDVDSCVFLGRYCRSFIEECPNLQRILLGGLTLDLVHQSTLKRATRRARGSKLGTDDSATGLASELDLVKGQLSTSHVAAFRLWHNWATSVLTHHFNIWLLSGDAAMLASATAWESIKLSEETESGKPLESIIEIPFQVSVFIMKLLFGVCKEINRVCGHTLDRTIGQELVGIVFEKVVSCYEAYQAKRGRIRQHLAIQNWFNLNFMCQLFNPSNSDEKMTSRTTKLTGWLESCIDPFDMSVLESFLQSNLTRQFQRCSVMLGPLISLSGSASAWHAARERRPGGITPTQEQHNILPLSRGVLRFTLLPHHLTPSRNVSREDRIQGTRQPFAQSISIVSYLKA